jgi:hypothetical protein
MSVLKVLPALFLAAGCASPMAGDFISTSTMGNLALVGVHTSDDENEEGQHEDHSRGSFGVQDADGDEDGRFEARDRARTTLDTDENEEGFRGL